MQCSFKGLGNRDLHVIHQLPGGDVPQVQEVVGQNSRLPQCKDTRWCCPNCCVCSISIPSALVIPKLVGDSGHEGVGVARLGFDFPECSVHRERGVQAQSEVCELLDLLQVHHPLISGERAGKVVPKVERYGRKAGLDLTPPLREVRSLSRSACSSENS